MTNFIDSRGAVWIVSPSKSDVDILNKIVLPPERPLVVAHAYLVRVGVPSVRKRIIAVTDSRFLCVRRGSSGNRIHEIPLGIIKIVELSGSIGSTLLIIRTGQGAIRFQLPRPMAEEVKHALDLLITGSVAPTPVSHTISAVQPPALAGRSDVEDLRGMIEHLETDVARLQQQVDFLEQLMRKR